MTLELEQAIKLAQDGDLQESILKLCEVIRGLQDDVSYLKSEID